MNAGTRWAVAGLVAGGMLVAGVPAVAGGPAVAGASAPVITTMAGGPGRGPALKVAQIPEAVAAGPGGAVYVADRGGVVRALTAPPAWEKVIAGAGGFGYSGDGRRAVSAVLAVPKGVVVDSAGNAVIADTGNDRVRVAAATTGTFYRQAMTAGNIYTVAGSSKVGFAGDGGPAVKAALAEPEGVAADSAGNLMIADTGNARIRVVAARTGTFYRQAMTAGDIYTVAGNGTRGYTGDGGPATAAELNSPGSAVVDRPGNLVIADTANHRIRVVAATTGTFHGQAMTAGHIYTIAGTGPAGYSGDGGPAASAMLNHPEGVAADQAGNLVIADTANHRVRVIAATTGTFYGQAMTAGAIYTVAGNGRDWFSGDRAKAVNAQTEGPAGAAVTGPGHVAVVGNNRVRIVAAASGTFYGRAMTAGKIYTVAGTGPAGYSGDGGPAASAMLNFPEGVAADRAGNLLIADTRNDRIRVVAARTGTFYGQAMTTGHIYTVAGTTLPEHTGDGGPATSAWLSSPYAVAVDGAGNLLIADSFDFVVRIVPATSGVFFGQAMTAGDIYTIAGTGKLGISGDGGPATSAALLAPEGVAADRAGNLLIPNDNRIRVVAATTGSFYGQAMTTGHIYTVAGTGDFATSGDGGPATSANLAGPTGVTVDQAGNVVIADTYSCRIRVVAATTGSFYGQAMTTGDIYTVAGSDAFPYSGDGGPATRAGLDDPRAVTVSGTGTLVIADTNDNRIRIVGG